MGQKKFRAKMAFSTEIDLDIRPTAAKDIASLGFGSENICARPRAFRVVNFAAYAAPHKILESRDGSVQIKVLNLSGGLKSDRIINADGDEIWYVASGKGRCVTFFGILKFAKGDYIFIPKSCAYYFQTSAKGSCYFVGIESESGFGRPNFDDFGNRNVPYQPEAIEKPKKACVMDAPDREGEWDVRVKRLGKYATKIIYPFSPFQKICWRGDIYPFLLHTSDINTLVSPTVHLDPSAFATFISPDKSVVVSTFKPRWIHSLPYHHMNYYDEFLFYATKYEARGSKIGRGDATFHPQGVWHGPQAEAIANEAQFEQSKDAPWSEEFAIMFETKKPLIVADIALDRKIEIKDYYKSWGG